MGYKVYYVFIAYVRDHAMVHNVCRGQDVILREGRLLFVRGLYYASQNLIIYNTMV